MASQKHRIGIAQRIKDLTARHPEILPILGLFGAYLVWIVLFKLISFSLITYFVATTVRFAGGSSARFEEVNEAYGSSEITVLALGAAFFVLFMRLLNPLTTTTTREIFDAESFEKRFLPGFLQGVVLAFGIILAFLLSGIYRYLGMFIQVEEAPLAAASILIRVLSVFVFVYFEEFIFRQKILHLFRSGRIGQSSDLTAASLTALLFVLAKFIQFDLNLGWMHGVTLFLISICLALRAIQENDFSFGTGYWVAMLLVFHPLLSLPVFGNEYAGLLLVKYQSSNPDDTTRFFTGGAGGPLASFAFQLLLIVDIAKTSLQQRRIAKQGLSA